MGDTKNIARSELEVNILNGWYVDGLISWKEWEESITPFVADQIRKNREIQIEDCSEVENLAPIYQNGGGYVF